MLTSTPLPSLPAHPPTVTIDYDARRSLSVFGLDSQRSAGDRRVCRYLGGVRCRPKPCRHLITLDSALGRSSVASGGNPFPPCLIAFPPQAINPPPTSTRSAARPRTNAVTLDATPGERFSPLPTRSRGCSPGVPLSHCGALLLFPSLRGSCSLRSRSPRHASTLRAEWPIRPAMTRDGKRCGL